MKNSINELQDVSCSEERTELIQSTGSTFSLEDMVQEIVDQVPGYMDDSNFKSIVNIMVKHRGLIPDKEIP